jgi:hypothetical protein
MGPPSAALSKSISYPISQQHRNMSNNQAISLNAAERAPARRELPVTDRRRVSHRTWAQPVRCTAACQDMAWKAIDDTRLERLDATRICGAVEV